MAAPRGDRQAFGQPGLPPRWAPGDKDGVGTAYSVASRIWYTIWNGIVTEVYFPTVDRPQTRDLQYLFTDGETFFHNETELDTIIECLGESLGYLVRGRDKDGRYSYEKEIISDPHAPCLLQRTKISAEPAVLGKLKLYVLCSPHLNVGGLNNTGEVLSINGRDLLIAHRDGIWLAMIATVPFSKASVGYVGVSDGWTDLAQGFQMEWQFDRAPDGNIALTGEIDLSQAQEFTLGVAFGESQHRAIATLAQSLAFPFSEKRQRFVEQWTRADRTREALEEQSGDGGKLYRTSVKLLLAHEDKLYPGAIVASLAIPWGESKDDHEGEGGYHLIWTRDMVQTAMGLLAAGNTETPLRALIYLATSQPEDGSFAQNFWVEGDAFWTGMQLDEVAFPILLAHRLWRDGGLRSFDPRPMVKKATGYLLREGPATRQERWEEAGGYSPSTLAVMIAALICAASFAREHGKEEDAVFVEQYADWLEHNLEQWTVTRKGTLVPGITDHFVRLVPAQPGDPLPDSAADTAFLTLSSQSPGTPVDYPAREIVDAGFLELVRYGIRRPDDPIVLNSLTVVDAVLKTETPLGTVWHRYNHDGYGQRPDGGPYEGHGKGRGWPLLTASEDIMR
jgi:glucoamylase